MNNKNMVIRMRKFLLLVEYECEERPSIQLKAQALRWDLEQMFSFPANAPNNAMYSDNEGSMTLGKSSIPGDEETFNNGHEW